MKNKIINWIRRQVKSSRAKGLVLGLSGGIDSAAVLALAKQAVGKGKVLAIYLPCHSHREHLDDARLVARKFGIKTKVIDLSTVYDTLIKALPKANKLALSNLKPRLRMLTLYYFANKFNYLVCGTGNKSEIMAGYFTKYGDGGVDILPIGDLLKSQVRELARELKIPESVITKPPTAGLWPGQTDEGEMGVTYRELDDIFWAMENKKKQILPGDKVNKIKGMVECSEHKRRMPKICKV
ncbi:MAG: NAD+ synthase [Candidatus Omnitrophota bacterium]